MKPTIKNTLPFGFYQFPLYFREILKINVQSALTLKTFFLIIELRNSILKGFAFFFNLSFNLQRN